MDPKTFNITEWEFRDKDEIKKIYEQAIVTSSVKVHKLTPPISEQQVREIKAGDVVELSGIIFTGRDAMHHYMLEHDAPFDLTGGVIYHCGPVINKDETGKWKITAAGLPPLFAKNLTKELS
jgi:fumarate hydratase class I